MEELVTTPTHSLVEQSMNTRMNHYPDGSLWSMNGDGFGIGWYAHRNEPGLFKDESPAWSNENLREVCAQIRARIFFAHVRATTTGAVQRSNCHPFKHKNWMFQHNGDVSDFELIRRDLQMEIAPELYNELKGTTDSETFFMLAVTYGLEKNPKEALRKMVQRVQKASADRNTPAVLNLSCALSDGKRVYTIRYSDNEKHPKTQFYKISDPFVNPEGRIPPNRNIVIVSEPLDHTGDNWVEVPHNSFLTAYKGEVVREEFM